MSYAQATKWWKSHPRGGKAQYMGFDTSSKPKIETEAEIREFHRTKYLAFHKKNNTDADLVANEDDYVVSRMAHQEREQNKWERLNRA